MNVFYKYDRQPVLFTTLVELLRHRQFGHQSRRRHLDDIENELTSRGWYENFDDDGRYLVVNMDSMSVTMK